VAGKVVAGGGFGFVGDVVVGIVGALVVLPAVEVSGEARGNRTGTRLSAAGGR
jgi:uncharacterized membrane protein YeaQ/YmgE (transglycosylase-associated protein family)